MKLIQQIEIVLQESKHSIHKLGKRCRLIPQMPI